MESRLGRRASVRRLAGDFKPFKNTPKAAALAAVPSGPAGRLAPDAGRSRPSPKLTPSRPLAMRIKRKKRPGSENLRPPWKPGQSGNPAGHSKFKREYGESFKKLVRELFASRGKDRERIRDELAAVAIKKAKRGNFFFWSKLVDLHETNTVSEDDLQSFIERVYMVVRRHVEKLEGGKEALSEIARELQKENE